jgi:hypothetical protein
MIALDERKGHRCNSSWADEASVALDRQRIEVEVHAVPTKARHV